MRVIELSAMTNGAHRNQNADFDITPLDGWAIVSEGLETPSTFPFVKNLVQDESGVVIGWEPDQEAYEAAMAAANPLSGAIESRIAQSKEDLAAYLDTHPITWTDGEQYSITAEKQAQLTSKIMAATMAQTLSQPYTLTWNSTGQVCREWTLQDLSALAFAIDARVTALVSYQQTQEVAMRNAATREELDAIVVDYDSVPEVTE
ncbi:hypothetical protein [uncultured Oscillibacter sp.]|uniref:DUF4376 domain-containing protein n=1 Tax=uncultured Oscillibacter sp. TaxID=876091 RepID=UPI002803F267|nr:hypothetical protein [uncultured Oscillibacter sp.]